jgi:putative oxidoreductase
MIVAILAVQRAEVDSFLTLVGLEEVMYLALFVWLAIAGAGSVSIDHRLERRGAA